MNRNKFSLYPPVSSLSCPTSSFSHFSWVPLLSPPVFVILPFLYSNFLTHCSYHDTISLFSPREKSLFLPLCHFISLSTVLCLPFPCLSTSHYLSLGLSTSSTFTRQENSKINLKVSVSLPIPESGSFCDFVIQF